MGYVLVEDYLAEGAARTRTGRAMRALDIAEQVNRARARIMDERLADIYGRTESPDAGVAITPCADDGDNSTFTCGLNTEGCKSDQNT